MRIRLLPALIPFVFIGLWGCGQPAPPYSGGASSLVYTKHARCRMDCRSVTEAEVNEILETGHVNTRKSDPDDTPCPTEAVEGRSSEGQSIRVVVAHCGDVDKVVTVIDLEMDKDPNCRCN